MLRTQRLPTIQGIGANQTGTLNIPLGPTYNTIFLTGKKHDGFNMFAGDWASHIGDIRLMVNGNVKIELSAEQLVARNNFYGQLVAAGVLPLHLTNPSARTVMGEDLTALGTFGGGLESLTLEVDFKTNVPTEFKVYAYQSEPRPFGKHLVIRRFSKSMASIGVDEVADLPRGSHNLLTLDINSADIGEIEVFADSNRVHVSDKMLRQTTLLLSGRTQQNGYTHLDFVPQNRIAIARAASDGAYVSGEAFPMTVQDFRLKLGFDVAPGSYQIIETTIQG